MEQIGDQIYRVLNSRRLTADTFILTFPQSRAAFVAGQHVNLSLIDEHIVREYSIYNSEESANLEVLVKEVEGGYFSPKLRCLKKGDCVRIDGPFGGFCLDRKNKDSHKHVLIASGTGIAPFHSMIKSNPGIDYHVIHGVRHANEGYEKEEYEKSRYTLCTSRDTTGDFSGRLTGYLEQTCFGTKTCFYLCGNSEMIYDAKEIIKNKGFEAESIASEVYF